jgi:hypothetical protein
MRVRATYFVARGLADLLSNNVEQAAAADDISRRNNLHVTRPNAPRHPDDSFDLDSVCGNGPDRSRELYDSSTGDIKFLVEVIPNSEHVSRKGAMRYDLPRDPNNKAIIAGGRNDENILMGRRQPASSA